MRAGIAVLALLLAGCGAEAPAQQPAAETEAPPSSWRPERPKDCRGFPVDAGEPYEYNDLFHCWEQP